MAEDLLKKQKPKQNQVAVQQVNTIIHTGFTLMASWRGDHWDQTEEDCMKLAAPLQEYLNDHQPQIAKAITKSAGPVALIIGAIAVLAKPLGVEYELWKTRKAGTGHAGTTANSQTGRDESGISLRIIEGISGTQEGQSGPSTPNGSGYAPTGEL